METPSSAAAFPTKNDHFKGKYPIWLGAVFLGLGLLCSVLNIWLMLLEGQFSGGVVLGLLLTLIGFLYLTRPYFAIAPNRLTLYNLLGSPVKRYPFESFAQFNIEGSSLYIERSKGENRTKTNLKRWMMRSADWQRLQTLVLNKSQR